MCLDIIANCAVPGPAILILRRTLFIPVTLGAVVGRDVGERLVTSRLLPMNEWRKSNGARCFTTSTAGSALLFISARTGNRSPTTSPKLREARTGFGPRLVSSTAPLSGAGSPETRLSAPPYSEGP